MNEVRAREVLATGLRRAVDRRVVGLSFATALVTVGLSMALHRAMPGSHDRVIRFVVAQLRTLFTLVPSVLGSAATVSAVLARERGEEPTYGSVLRRLPLLYVTQIFTTLAVGMGIAFLILPGMYVAVVMSVITPVVLEEGVSPLSAWARCLALLEGRGDVVWSVALSAWMLMALVIAACLLPFALPLGMVETMRALGSLRDPGIVAGLVLARFGYGAIWAGISGVLYVRLRERELPTEAEKLARVFD